MLIPVVAFILLVAYVSVYLANRILTCYHAQRFFQTKSPKLPIMPSPNIFLGNIHQTIWQMKNCHIIDRWHDKLGKTFGQYVANKPLVSTKDIDLLKKILIDDSNKHLDRLSFDFPSHEFSTSIFQLNGNEWRSVRRVIAPTVT